MGINKGLQLLQQYPADQLWRLFVDGQMAEMDKGPKRFDKREPGCINAMMKAFAVTMNGLPMTPLTVGFIKTIAKTAMDLDVFRGKNVAKGETRCKMHLNCFFRLNRLNKNTKPGMAEVTEAGLADFIRNFEDPHRPETAAVGILIARKNFNGPAPYVGIGPAAIFSLGSLGVDRTEHDDQIVKIFQQQGSKLSPQEITALSAEEKASTLMRAYDEIAKTENETSGFCYVAPGCPLVDEALEWIVQQYNDEMQAANANPLTTANDKLRIIARTIQRCEQLHPFEDGNGRVFVNCLLNGMLIQEGFRPATFYDPNVFDIRSVDEIVVKIEDAMTATRNLIENPNAEVHSLKVRDFKADNNIDLSEGIKAIRDATKNRLDEFTQQEVKINGNSAQTASRSPLPQQMATSQHDSDSIEQRLREEVEKLRKENLKNSDDRVFGSSPKIKT